MADCKTMAAFASLAELNDAMAAEPPHVKGGTHAVPGTGPAHAAIALVGEQPGDREDRAGLPFVGPAGQLLDRALAEAKIARRAVYVTNAVKHFKFERQGKRRLGKKPTVGEVAHYRPWLLRELELVKPRIVVALGATAARALAGRAISVTAHRGPMPFDGLAGGGMAGYVTVHPSYLLRLGGAARRTAYVAFVADLRRAARMARTARRSSVP